MGVIKRIVKKLTNTIKKLTGWFFMFIGICYLLTGWMYMPYTASFSVWTGQIVGMFFFVTVFFYVGWRLVTEEVTK